MQIFFFIVGSRRLKVLVRVWCNGWSLFCVELRKLGYVLRILEQVGSTFVCVTLT